MLKTTMDDRVPKPGSFRGPCKHECPHQACHYAFKIAYERCAFCGDEIGFEAEFCRRPQGVQSERPYSHVGCVEEYARRKRGNHET